MPTSLHARVRELLVEPIRHHDKSAACTSGSSGPFRWQITLPPDLADMVARPLGVDGPATSIDRKPRGAARWVPAECANTVGHECRHGEQVSRITQWARPREFEAGRKVSGELVRDGLLEESGLHLPNAPKILRCLADDAPFVDQLPALPAALA